jgi:hypothetical protein
MTRRRHPIANRTYLVCATVAVGIGFVASCGPSGQVPGRVLDVVKSCGTVVYSGYAGIFLTPIVTPTVQDRIAAPPADTVLPPALSGQSASARIAVFRFTLDCDHGDQVTVTPLTGLYAGTVARSKDGGITGLNLQLLPTGGSVPFTVYDYRHGRLVGVAHVTR